MGREALFTGGQVPERDLDKGSWSPTFLTGKGMGVSVERRIWIASFRPLWKSVEIS